MVRSSGAVTDRPWGVTLAALGVQGFTGLLTMTADGKEYSISFALGRIVGATSPLASDAAVRMALTNHLISSSQASALNRQIVAAKERDELEVLAELANLTPDHIDKLRHRLVAQRAARTFALDNGTYVADERSAMPPGADLDPREVIYLGARLILSEQRLALAVRAFGSVFTIKRDALPSLEQFGFGTDERPVIQSLRAGAGLPQLEAAHRDVDPRMVQAIVYALMSCGACDAERSSTTGGVVEYAAGPEASSRPAPPPEGATYFVSRTPTNPGVASNPVELPRPNEIPTTARPRRTTAEVEFTPRAPSRPVDDGVARIPPAMSRTETGEPIVSLPPSSDPTGFRGDPVVPRTATARPGAANPTYRAPGQPTIPRAPSRGRPTTGPSPGRTQTSDPIVARTASGGPAIARTSTARRTQALIAARMLLVEQAADYFTLLGVPFDAPIDVVQTAYLNLVRQLHPDKLEELGVPDTTGNAQLVFQRVGLAFTVLTDPARRAIYLEKLAKPPPAPPPLPPPEVELTARTRTADGIPASPAGDAYRRGESALRRDEPAAAVIEFGRACALEPGNVDFHAMLGWAQFCAARDKVTIAPETRKVLDRAVRRSDKPTQARFLLGRVERMLGRDREALRHFQEVVETSEQHADAAAEIRAIEARLAKPPGKR